MRDDFNANTKESLAKRVGHRCSNPQCRSLTTGPQTDPAKFINIGVASHITAASSNGPRYDSSLTSEERSSPANGIWLCQKCGKLVDNDATRYTVAMLHEWKRSAEGIALREIEGKNELPQTTDTTNKDSRVFSKLERMIPNLLAEMRKDLEQFPFRREFVVLDKSWIYRAKGNELVYYLDDHDELLGKLQILKGHGLISEITYNSVKRFTFSEALADYLHGN